MNPPMIRRHILRMAFAGQSRHIAPALSCVEILVAIDEIMRPGDDLILSKAHGAMALYGLRYEKGELADADLDGYFGDGSTLWGHAKPFGALGHGLSVGVGMALAKQRKAESGRIFVVVGDGELNEGACWEAIMAATQWGLSNLVIVVDRNGYQGLGPTGDVLGAFRLADKLQGFGCAVAVCEQGNSVAHLETDLARLLDIRDGIGAMVPVVLIARTTKGAGVTFMAYGNEWHYRKLTPELYGAAMAELA